MTEQRTPGLPGGWLPPVPPDTLEPERHEPPPSPFGEERRPWWKRLGGPLASEWIHALALAIKAEVRVEVLLDSMFQFPTFSELVLTAVRGLDL